MSVNYNRASKTQAGKYRIIKFDNQNDAMEARCYLLMAGLSPEQIGMETGDKAKAAIESQAKGVQITQRDINRISSERGLADFFTRAEATIEKLQKWGEKHSILLKMPTVRVNDRAAVIPTIPMHVLAEKEGAAAAFQKALQEVLPSSRIGTNGGQATMDMGDGAVFETNGLDALEVWLDTAPAVEAAADDAPCRPWGLPPGERPTGIIRRASQGRHSQTRRG